MIDLSKLTKAQLIELIQNNDDTKFDDFKEELNLDYDTDEEWINYIKDLQTKNAERCNDINDLSDELKAWVDGLERANKVFSNRAPN